MTYYEAEMKLLNDKSVEIVRTMYNLYEEIRQENFLKWIGDYPDYWKAICEMDYDEILPEFAEKVMDTLIKSNITELQMIWLFKCRNKIDILGKAAEEQ